MAKDNTYIYFVEGECEKHIISFLKNNYIVSGRVLKLNPIQELISATKLRILKPNTVAILIFDTDTNDGLEKLNKNKLLLNRTKNIKDIITVPQVENFEDELIRATVIKNIKKFTKSKSTKDFKRDFLKTKMLINC